MSQPSLSIPLRTSSVNAQTSGLRMGNNSKENLRCEKPSKAHKILGTTDIPLQNGQLDAANRGRRTSFMATSEMKSTKSGTFVPFPSATLDANIPPQHLRVRASSPLLGQDYRSRDPCPAVPKHSTKIHQFGPASALFSYFNTRDSVVEQDPSKMSPGGELGVDGNSHSQRTNPGARMSLRPTKGPSKESRRKMRPPRIDLSLLFPKPRETAAPLLSPQRMMSSPSPISMTSEYSSAKAKRPDPPAAGKRLTRTPPSRHPGHQLDTLQENDNTNKVSVPRESKNLDYLDTSFERTVRTSEFDLALDKYYDAKSLKSTTSAQSGPSNLQSQNRGPMRSNDFKSAENAQRRMSSGGSAGGWSKETYLSPKSCARSKPNRISNSPNTWKTDLHTGLNAHKDLMSKKSSKSTLKNADLNNSSVLCLSSSEDESDEEEEASKGRSEADNRGARDSITTFGEFDVEICTAATAQATRGPTLQRVDKANSASNRSSQALQKNAPLCRNPSMSSAGKSSSATTRKSQSRRSSGIPTISEPDSDNTYSQFRNPPLPQKEHNRRSRVMAVTRQEEHLLEAMRQRQGKITPSLFQEARYTANLEPDAGSMLSAPSRDSFYGSDTSFLRLSPKLPASSRRTDQGAIHHGKDGTVPQGAASDAEQKTIDSSRLSMAYSESLSSPSTSAASPLTPTLPIYRFPRLPSQKPPPRRPPPSVPQHQKRHSRRRTDSSEAIVLDDAEQSPEGDEFPVWALGWNHDGGSLTAVH